MVSYVNLSAVRALNENAVSKVNRLKYAINEVITVFSDAGDIKKKVNLGAG